MTSLQHSPLCVQLCSSAILTALVFRPGILSVFVLYSHLLILQSPGLFLDYKAAVPMPSSQPSCGLCREGQCKWLHTLSQRLRSGLQSAGTNPVLGCREFPLFLCSGMSSLLLVGWDKWGCPDRYPAASALLCSPDRSAAASAAAGPQVNPEKCSQGVVAQLREQGRISPTRGWAQHWVGRMQP